MKKLGYYPALVVLMLVYMTVIGVCVVQSMATLDRMKSYKSSGEMLKISQKQLEDEQTRLAENQKIDKVYNDYFTRWTDKEGKIDEPKLKLRLQKMAEELGLNVLEIVPFSAQATAANGHPGQMTPAPMGMGMSPGMPVPPPGMGGLARPQTRNLIELKVTLVGPFQQLMAWMKRAENELGSLRFVQTRWVARSPDEVRLTVGFHYKMIGEEK